MPATPIEHRLTWDKDEANRAAQGRLGVVLERLRGLRAEASGEIGTRDPVSAVKDALLALAVDEVILSTLPVGRSRWLRQDVPAGSWLRSPCLWSL